MDPRLNERERRLFFASRFRKSESDWWVYDNETVQICTLYSDVTNQICLFSSGLQQKGFHSPLIDVI